MATDLGNSFCHLTEVRRPPHVTGFFIVNQIDSLCVSRFWPEEVVLFRAFLCVFLRNIQENTFLIEFGVGIFSKKKL